MKDRTFIALVISLLIVFIMSGCAAGKKEYEIGMQLHSSGKYGEAIAYLSQAVAKEPGNKEYKRSLREIKESLVAKYVADAGKVLEESPPLAIGAINEAKNLLDKAREIDGSHADVLEMAKRVAGEEESLLGRVKELYDDAVNHMETGEWVKASFNLQQIQSLFPNYENTFQLSARVKTEGPASYVKEGKALFEREDFKGAGELLRKALSLDGEHSESLGLMKLVEERDTIDFFLGKAKEDMAKKAWDRAVYDYERALEYAPDNRDLIGVMGVVRENAGNYYIDKARAQLTDGWLYRAYDSYGLALKYIDDPGDYRLGSLKNDLVAGVFNGAEYFKEQENYGAAWFWYKKVEEINPHHLQIFQRILDMEDKIGQRVRKSIAVFDFDSPSNNRDAGIIIANNLITFLFKSASGDIKIMEREKLKSIVEEMKLGQIGVVDERSAKEMGRVLGIDIAIMGTVMLFKVDSASSESTKSVRYQVGTKTEDNIEYQNWLARHPDPTKNELETAPPAKIKVPEYRHKDYNVSHTKKIGFVELSFRIVDVGTGETTQVKTVKRTMVDEDDTSDGLPEAGIRLDPLEIKTDTELLQKMTGDVVAELGREVLRPLQNLEQIYFQDAETLLRRRDEFAAVEKFVDAVFDEKLKRVSESPITEQAMVRIREIFSNHNLGI